MLIALNQRVFNFMNKKNVTIPFEKKKLDTPLMEVQDEMLPR